QLLDAVDTYIPEPERKVDQPFLMPIEDVFTIEGRGTVVTGRVERGQQKLNEEVEITGIRETRKTVVTGIEMFHKQMDSTQAGDIKLPEGVEMVMPGDHVEMDIELITPIAIEEGLRFAIREGGRTVGAGVVTSVSN